MRASPRFREAVKEELNRLREQKDITRDMQAVLSKLEALETPLIRVLTQAKANKSPAQYQLKDALQRVQNAIYQLDTALKVEKGETSRARKADWPR